MSMEGNMSAAKRSSAHPGFAVVRHTLSDDEVYAVTAFILGEAEIIGQDDVMDAETLPQVQMPNRDGFVPDPRPDVFNYD
jgi:hypothetical protein